MAPTFQVAQLTATTDASGYLSWTFDNPISQVMACANSPQAGGGVGIVSVTVWQNGAKTCRARVWVESTGWTVIPAANAEVTITLLGIS